MASFFSRRFKFIECIEQSFFKTIIIIGTAGCLLSMVLDLFLLKQSGIGMILGLIMTGIFILILICLRRFDFHKVANYGVLMLCMVVITRGWISDDYNEITCTILITLGFVSALVSRKRTGIFVQTVIFICLMAILFKHYPMVEFILMLRKAIPYVAIYCIVTVCSGLLKSRYETNQDRLREMVELLNRKNEKIKEQHLLLKKNFCELEQLNVNLETIIAQKTEKITEKNKHLADIAYANAHTIRGPLARILGLANLFKLDPQNQGFYVSKIDEEATRMDDILFTITKDIEMNIYK